MATTSSERCENAQKKTIAPDHVLEALESGKGTQPRLHEQVDNAQLALEAAQEKARFDTLDPTQRLEQQQAVVDLLQSLADQLRQDEAQWAAQEVLRALWDEQQALQQRTATLPHLPRSRQEALQEQAQDQSRLADNVIRAASSLREAAAQEQDSVGARAMRQAAEALEQGPAAGHMRDAAAHLDAAHDARAAVAQQQAAMALQQVSDALRDGLERQQSNVARLQRSLIDLRALVMRLLERQQALVEHLEGTTLAAETGSQAERIRRGMLAAAQRASRSGEEDTGIAFTLQAAARANESVTGALYARPPARAVALEAAHEAVTALLRAIDLLDDTQSRLEDMEQRKATDGLVGRLREWATAQATLITRTDETLDSGPLDRRARFTARQLGQAQGDLAAAVRQGATDSPLLESSLVTARALDQVATIAQDTAEVLLDGRMTVDVSSGQKRVLDMLEAMAAAFADLSAGTGGRFAGAGGGGGTDGGASSRAGDQNVRLPTVAELQVLRSWQAQLLEACGPDAGTHSSEMLDRLASEQASLASLGAALVEAMGPPAPRVETREAPPGMRMPPTDYAPAPPVEPLPSLDALLGLDSNVVDTPMPPVPDDALQAMTARLRQSAVALSAHELTQSRRLQQDALDRIDALLEQARQQPAQGAQSPVTGTSSQQAPATAEEAGQGTGAEATGARAGQGDQQLRVVQPGGGLAHEGRSWGALPPRLRRLLEQGRRDVRSEIHADTTERYFRLLLEVDR